MLGNPAPGRQSTGSAACNLPYCPRQPDTHEGSTHHGYAFINFTTTLLAEGFIQLWQKRRVTHNGVSKRLSIIPTEVQGFEKNVRQMKKKRVARISQEGSAAPIILVRGHRFDISDL